LTKTKTTRRRRRRRRRRRSGKRCLERMGAAVAAVLVVGVKATKAMMPTTITAALTPTTATSNKTGSCG
jgi:hypothetical protein